MTYKDFWAQQNINLQSGNDDWWQGNCPMEDCPNPKHHFYVNIITGYFCCKRCGAEGRTEQFIKEHGIVSTLDVQQQQDYIPEQITADIFDKDFVKRCQRDLRNDLTKLKAFSIDRGVSPSTLTQFGTGWDTKYQSFVVPSYSPEGYLTNIFIKKLGKDTISSPGAKSFPFNCNRYKFVSSLFLVEGCWSAMALCERGFKALGYPGSLSFSKGWAGYFTNKRIYIIPDNDDAGILGAQRIKKILSGVTTQVFILFPPQMEYKADIRDWFNAGHTKAELELLILREGCKK